MELDLMRLCCDFGLVVLVWMVQLVIYPSFQYYEPQNLVTWHRRYATRLSMIVMPLMFGQLLIASLQCFRMSSTENSISLGLVIMVWIVTGIQFVPIHNKIANNDATPDLLKQLVDRNWWRTLLWTFIFSWSVYLNV